jgi:hypothetical protein
MFQYCYYWTLRKNNNTKSNFHPSSLKPFDHALSYGEAYRLRVSVFNAALWVRGFFLKWKSNYIQVGGAFWALMSLKRLVWAARQSSLDYQIYLQDCTLRSSMYRVLYLTWTFVSWRGEGSKAADSCLRIHLLGIYCYSYYLCNLWLQLTKDSQSSQGGVHW